MDYSRSFPFKVSTETPPASLRPQGLFWSDIEPSFSVLGFPHFILPFSSLVSPAKNFRFPFFPGVGEAYPTGSTLNPFFLRLNLVTEHAMDPSSLFPAGVGFGRVLGDKRLFPFPPSHRDFRGGVIRYKLSPPSLQTVRWNPPVNSIFPWTLPFSPWDSSGPCVGSNSPGQKVEYCFFFFSFCRFSVACAFTSPLSSSRAPPPLTLSSVLHADNVIGVSPYDFPTSPPFANTDPPFFLWPTTKNHNPKNPPKLRDFFGLMTPPQYCLLYSFFIRGFDY